MDKIALIFAKTIAEVPQLAVVLAIIIF